MYKTELTVYKTPPAVHKVSGHLSGILLLLACLAVLLPCLQFFVHNDFGWQALGELVAYSSLGRTAAPIPGQDIDVWQQQDLVTEAEAVSAEEPPLPAEETKPALTAEQLAHLKEVFYKRPEAGKMVALTFDDGPSGQFTSQYLKVLDQYGVRATFFLLGLQVQRNPGLAAMIADSGQEIGNHTFSHRNLKHTSLAAAKQDITFGAQLIEQDSHQKIIFFRPPGGNLNQPLTEMIKGMGLKIILWNIDPRDWDPASSKERIINNVLSNLQPGSIVVMHEGHQNTLDALPSLIEGIRQRGYQIVTISELLAAGSANEPQQQAAQEPQAEATASTQQTETETPAYTQQPERETPAATQQPPHQGPQELRPYVESQTSTEPQQQAGQQPEGEAPAAAQTPPYQAPQQPWPEPQVQPAAPADGSGAAPWETQEAEPRPGP